MKSRKQDSHQGSVIPQHLGGHWVNGEFVCGPKVYALCKEMRSKVNERALKGVRNKERKCD